MDTQTHELRCNVADLLHRPAAHRAVRVEADAAVFVTAGAAHFANDAPVVVDVELEHVPDGIVVHGRTHATALTECSRCLAPIELPVDASIRELFEVNPLEGQTYPLVVDAIDLAEPVRDVLLLELPAAPLCRPDCAGLCPVCGADRNESACDCDTTVRDPRWDVLAELELTN